MSESVVTEPTEESLENITEEHVDEQNNVGVAKSKGRGRPARKTEPKSKSADLSQYLN